VYNLLAMYSLSAYLCLPNKPYVEIQQIQSRNYYELILCLSDEFSIPIAVKIKATLLNLLQEAVMLDNW
jgi:hypothetical protein